MTTRALQAAIVHDDLGIRKEIVACIEGVDTASFSWAGGGSVSEGRDLLSRSHFDLLVVDMALPKFANEVEIEEAGGLDLVREMATTDYLKRATYVVGVTSHEELYLRLRETFPWSLIYIDSKSDRWKEQLVLIARHLVDCEERRASMRRRTDLCIVTALESELGAVLSLPCEWSDALPLDRKTFVHVGHFVSEDGRERSVLLVSPLRMGMVHSAIALTKALQLYDVGMVAMVGICGGVESKVKIGELVAAQCTWDWQQGKYISDESGDTQLLPSPQQFRIDESLEATLRLVAREHLALDEIRSTWKEWTPSAALRLRIGPIASGSSVLADGGTTSTISRNNRDALGFDMEAHAIFAAASSSAGEEPTVLVLKTVVDYGDKVKNDQAQPYGCYASARALFWMCQKHLGAFWKTP